MKVKIVDFKETKIAVLEHRGDPKLLNNSIQKFIKWRKETGISPINSSNSYSLVYDDPNNTKPEDFRFDLCGSIISEIPENKYGIINKAIPAGRCAVLRHKGSHDLLPSKIYDLYGKWLPASKEKLRDFPMFFHYVNLTPDVLEDELITDIYIPLK